MNQPTYPTLRLLLLLVTARCATAQLSPPSLSYIDNDKSPYKETFNAATAVLIVLIISAFFFLAFFSLYLRRCTSRDRLSAAAVLPHTAAVEAMPRGGGLDPSVISTFPTLTYSAATALKIGKESLECAVCLSEFADHESLRMLPKCCHVFHPDCIDTWLATHVTCPVCRANLSEAVAVDPTAGSETEADVAATTAGMGSVGRSHSMSHVTGGGDRFRLRLPEHVRREILRRSASVAVFGRGGGEWSSRRGSSSERWAPTSGILARISSTWRKGGESREGSSRGGRMFGRHSGAGETSTAVMLARV